MSDKQPAIIDSVQLGKSGIWITPMGVGTWAWGDRKYWGYGDNYQEGDVRSAFRISLEAGIRFFDTSEKYGEGLNEILLGKLIEDCKQSVVVATKYDPSRWRRWKLCVPYAARGSLKRLKLPKVDLYQIHWPNPPMSIENMAEGLAEAVEAGLTRAVGVSNYDESQMRKTYEVLAKRGIALATNQVRYSLLRREVENNGVLKACQELGVTLIAWSPIAEGILSGKYTPDRLPPGVRGTYYDKELLSKVQTLIEFMRGIGEAHGGKTPSQVALNWLIRKGATPIPGAKDERQARENVGTLGWRLTDLEVEALDEVSSKY